MRPPEYQHYQNDGTARGIDGDDSGYRSLASESPLRASPRRFGGACWFLGMMLLVAGSTAAAQGAVMIGAMVLIAGLATRIGCGRADELNAPATAGAFEMGWPAGTLLGRDTEVPPKCPRSFPDWRHGDSTFGQVLALSDDERSGQSRHGPTTFSTRRRSRILARAPPGIRPPRQNQQTRRGDSGRN
jgi:hypothetical protein